MFGLAASALGVVAFLVAPRSLIDLLPFAVACALGVCMAIQLLSGSPVPDGEKNEDDPNVSSYSIRSQNSMCRLLGGGLVVLLCSMSSLRSIFTISNGLSPSDAHLLRVGDHGARLFFQCQGHVSRPDTHPPIFLLNGAGTPSTIWRHYLEDLAQETQVCVTDYPGIGWSNRDWHLWRNIDNRTLELYASYVRQMINVRGFKQVDLVGHSLGAAVADYTARRYPGLVRKVVGLDWAWTPMPVVHGLHNRTIDEPLVLAAMKKKITFVPPQWVFGLWYSILAIFVEHGMFVLSFLLTPAGDRPMFAFMPYADAFYAQGVLWMFADLTQFGFPDKAPYADELWSLDSKHVRPRASYLSVEATRDVFVWKRDPAVTKIFEVPGIVGPSGKMVEPDHNNIIVDESFARLVLLQVRDFLWGKTGEALIRPALLRRSRATRELLLPSLS